MTIGGDPGRRLVGLLRPLNDATEGTRNAKLHWVACRVGEMLATRELVDADQAADTLTQDPLLGTGLEPARSTRPPSGPASAKSGVVV